MIKLLKRILCVSIVGSCMSLTAQASPATKLEALGNGVWRMVIGSPDDVDLLSELKLTPKWDAINQLGAAELPIDISDMRVDLVDNKTYLRLPLDKGEELFGLGLHFKTVEQRGRTMRLHVDHYGGKDNGRTHAPVPFYVSSKGYGALINAARYIDIYAGTSNRTDSKNPPAVKNRTNDPTWTAMPYSDNLEFRVPTEGVEIIFFSGKSMLDVVRRFNLYNGGGALPPKWGLGFWHRTPTMFSAQEVIEEVKEFEKRGYPLSVIGLEPGWMDHSYPCSYVWDEKRFPNPESFVEEMTKRGIKTNLWINEGILPNGELGKKIAPYCGTHTIWTGLIPDYTMPEAKEIAVEHFEKNQLDWGVSGYKMDENDGYDKWIFPDVALFPSGTTAEQMRQIYGSLMQQFTTEMYRERNQRTYGLVRSANAGTSSFPYVLYNDYYIHQDFITALINSSFIGVLWTPEVRASKSSEEWLRRMQSVCFSPMAMLNAWSSGTKPWSFDDVEDDVLAIAKLRMRLIPYLYTAFAEYAFRGTPPMRAMNLEPSFRAVTSSITEGKLDDTDNPYAMAIKKEMKDQFMFGKDILVAPMFAGEKSRKVTLPQGKWYDFYTGECVGEGEVIVVEPGLSKIPVYVRDGGIVPLYPEITNIGDEKLPLEIRHYGEKPATYMLYDDDGSSYNYEDGDYTYLTINVKVAANGKKRGEVKTPRGAKLWSFNGEYEFKFMTK